MRDEISKIIEKIDTEKYLISITWFVNGIHNLRDVSKRTIYDSLFFYDSVISDLVQSICATSWRRIFKAFKTHLENACSHNSKKSHECLEGSRALRIVHPIDSLDLPSNDFFFFWDPKSKLQVIVIR
jgi:hypothetical protein